ncbi:ChbG/HpnK family deacetylase [Paenibacillus sp. JTLBN-2024]
MGKKLILNCDDFGQSPALNQAIMALLEEGKVSSATIMTVAPGFEEAAAWIAKRRQPNVGLHLTMTSEFEALRWRSLTGDRSLHDDSGYQYRTVKEFEQGAAPRAVMKEIDAQYGLARKAGIAVSHVDNHMGSLYGMETGRSLLPQTLWKVSRWKLPMRFFAAFTRRIRCLVPWRASNGRWPKWRRWPTPSACRFPITCCRILCGRGRGNVRQLQAVDHRQVIPVARRRLRNVHSSRRSRSLDAGAYPEL